MFHGQEKNNIVRVSENRNGFSKNLKYCEKHGWIDLFPIGGREAWSQQHDRCAAAVCEQKFLDNAVLIGLIAPFYSAFPLKREYFDRFFYELMKETDGVNMNFEDFRKEIFIDGGTNEYSTADLCYLSVPLSQQLRRIALDMPKIAKYADRVFFEISNSIKPVFDDFEKFTATCEHNRAVHRRIFSALRGEG